jgi:hypothetical protein
MHYNQILSMQFHFKLKNACKNQQCSLKSNLFFFHTKKNHPNVVYPKDIPQAHKWTFDIDPVFCPRESECVHQRVISETACCDCRGKTTGGRIA